MFGIRQNRLSPSGTAGCFAEAGIDKNLVIGRG
jgi:hypothetical protein